MIYDYDSNDIADEDDGDEGGMVASARGGGGQG